MKNKKEVLHELDKIISYWTYDPYIGDDTYALICMMQDTATYIKELVEEEEN